MRASKSLFAAASSLSSFLLPFLLRRSQPFLHFFGFGRRRQVVPSSGRGRADGRRLLGCSVAVAVEWAEDGGTRTTAAASERRGRWFGQVQPATGWQGGREGKRDRSWSLTGGCKPFDTRLQEVLMAIIEENKNCCLDAYCYHNTKW